MIANPKHESGCNTLRGTTAKEAFLPAARTSVAFRVRKDPLDALASPKTSSMSDTCFEASVLFRVDTQHDSQPLAPRCCTEFPSQIRGWHTASPLG